MKRTLLALAFCLGLVPELLAQVATGNIYGSVADESGAVLPGASITVSGSGTAPRSTSSDPQGAFRFLNLDPGTYKMTVGLSGFGTVSRSVVVNSGINVNLSFALKLASVEETVTITAETPVVDTKRTGTSTTLTHDELALTPNARDPWAVLRSIPGVTMDRVNIAGSETGQQAQFTGKGSTIADTMWSLDGIVITDPAAAGASPAYYDFDAFQEISYTTGGSDVKVATSGIGINFVTKRGTNAFHGSGRWFFTHDDLQSSNLPSELASDRRLRNADGTFRDKADHIQQISDYGADIGGPIVKDKLWFWGSYGKQDIRLVRLAGSNDKTLLPVYNGKLNWQPAATDTLSLTYFQSAKQKFGRSTGVPLVEDDAHLRDQGAAYGTPLHGFFKGEWDHTFGPSFILNAKYAFYDQGFTLTPRGGTAQDELQDFVNGVALGSYYDYRSTRPTHTVQIDTNYFRGHHELKAGFYLRRGTVTSSNVPSGGQIRSVLNPGGGLTASEAVLLRSSVVKFGGQYVSGYVGDTFTRSRLTLNLGLRFDHQSAGNQASVSPGNASFPALLPDLSYDGSGPRLEFNDLSPRLGLTYALSDSRKTLLRASFARYNGQQNWGDSTSLNPVGGVGRLTYHWNDANGDGFTQPGEVDFASGQLAPVRFGTLENLNGVDPNFHASHDLEAIVGFSHELLPDMALDLAYTWKRQTGAPWVPWIGLSSANFAALPAETANGFTATAFSPGDDPPAAFTGGYLLQNRPDYHRSYSGAELALNKRLSHKWLARVAFSYASWTEHFTGPGAIQDPTPSLYDTYGYFTPNAASISADPLRDGGQFTSYGAGSGRAVFFGGKWSLSANALYQLPAGFDLSGALFARQGFPLLTNISIPQGFLGLTRQTMVDGAVDARRLPDLWNLDLRLAKNLKLSGGTALVLTADVFNVLNAGTALNRQTAADSAVFDRLDTILNPRIVRVGVRFQF